MFQRPQPLASYPPAARGRVEAATGAIDVVTAIVATCTDGGAGGDAILTSLNLMGDVITLQPYRLGALLISDGFGRAAPAIFAAAGARRAAAAMVAGVIPWLQDNPNPYLIKFGLGLGLKTTLTLTWSS